MATTQSPDLLKDDSYSSKSIGILDTSHLFLIVSGAPFIKAFKEEFYSSHIIILIRFLSESKGNT